MIDNDVITIKEAEPEVMTYAEIRQKLFKEFEGEKGTDGLRNRIMKAASALGMEPIDAEQMSSDVVAMIKKNESNKVGAKLGVAHDPVKQTKHLAKKIAEMRY